MAFTALIITADLESRKQFKESFSLHFRFDNVYYSCSLTQAIQKLDGSEDIHVVFISSRFDGNIVSEFISSAKKKARGATSAYILVFDTLESNFSDMLSYNIDGADGFFFEPYSAADAGEIVELARQIGRTRSQQQVELMIEKHIARSIAAIDEVANKSKGKVPPKHSLRAERSSMKLLNSLNSDMEEHYFTKLIQRTETRKPPQPLAPTRNKSGGTIIRKR